MDKNIAQVFPCRQVQQGKEMADVAVHPAVGQKADQVQGGIVLLRVVHRSQQYLVFKKLAFLDVPRNAGQFLVNDPTGADVEVAHLRVAHLAFRQADRLTGGLQPAVRVIGHEAFHVGRVRPGDGVPLGAGIQSPSVQDDQDEGRILR